MPKGNKTINDFAVKASNYLSDEKNTSTVVGAGVFAVTGLISGALIVPAILGVGTTYIMNQNKKGKK